MREILFRGKRLDNGEWEYGSIVHQTDYYGTPVDRWFIIDGTDTQDYDIGFETEVDPSTVGQYTGLTDTNGKGIFEGDILKIAKKMDSLGTFFFPPIEYPVYVTVKWDMCSWEWEVQGKEKYYIHFPDAWCHYKCEVIGNIHDNAELLGGADNG